MKNTKQITGILISVDPIAKTSKSSFVTYNDDIHEMYRLIGCERFDCVELQFGDQVVDGYVDDEGLINGLPIAVTHIGGRDLAGNILLIGHDKYGDSKSLTKKQIDAILDALRAGVYMEVIE